MNNNKSSSVASFWKYLLILPLLLLGLLYFNGTLFNSTQDETKEIKKETEPSSSTDLSDQPIAERSNPSRVANFQKRNLDLSPITGFGVSNNGKVILRQAKHQKVSLEGPADVLDRLNTTVEKGYWRIGFKDEQKFKLKNLNLKKGKKEEESFTVYLDVVSVENISVSGLGQVQTSQKITSEKDVLLQCSGTGNMNINVEAPKITCLVSGIGNIKLKGSSDFLDAKISGSGNIDGADFATKKSDLSISGSGNVTAQVSQKIDANISGVGSVQYIGDPSIKQNISGQGSISKLR